ncbi:YhfH family protein [Planococcaceae bacterium Storch 2/2-2]|nr:YhfH family protein [Planococcaceae bacterium Storch 2/2-2]MUV05659.1 YhfH family protein [Planococcaceae bacterium Storch 2/2-2]MUV05660.1 YhfH family protein [Planococcaceae bacterium Storch 2/2-2]
MMTNIVQFFRNLPAKVCTTCGHEIEEQHECYSNTCDSCNMTK